jgi:ribosomal protein S18 acetylase RimI-like enzyme
MLRQNETKGDPAGIELGPVDASEVDEVIGVLTRGMRDNPLHVAVFGADPDVRLQRLTRLFRPAMVVMGWERHMLAARGPEGEILGVCGMLPPGECRPSLGQQLRLLPGVLAMGPATTLRTMRWMGTWAKRDPEERHWHLGPVAVDAHAQGKGVGSLLLGRFSELMDAAGEVAYLETDREINVRFYRRFGFEIVGEEQLLSVTNSYMIRRPGGGNV